ncbi:MAG: hypothetical protein R3A10_02475 [Caldilineaceae bacterium]
MLALARSICREHDVPGRELKFAGVIPASDLTAMSDAIKQGCETVDIDGGRFLLDTNIVIAPFPVTVRYWNLPAQCVSVPCIVLGELYYGARNSSRVLETQAESGITENCPCTRL